MPEEIRLTIGSGAVIHFYDFIHHPESQRKVEQLAQYFGRMPKEHIRAVYPILIINVNPVRPNLQHEDTSLRGGPGGTMFPEEPGARYRALSDDAVAVRPICGGAVNFMGIHRARLSGVEDSEVRRIILNHPGKGISFIPRNRWIRPQYHTTVLHEAAHCVDHWKSLRPRDHHLLEHIRSGVKGVCGGSNKECIEAYARHLYHPNGGVRNKGTTVTDKQIIDALHSTEAFQFISASSLWTRSIS